MRLIAAESIPVSTEDYKTRDVLMFGGVTTSGDTLYTLVCHLPSKLGGELARSHRGRIAKVMRNVADTIATNHPNAVVVVMGDFNEDMYEDDYRESFGFVDGFVNKEGFEDLMYSVRQEIGTHNFGGRWSCLDHILVKLPKDESWETPNAIIFDAPFLLQSDDRHLDVKPFRTYVAMNYKGGYSDHLPIYVDLKKSVR